MIEHPTLRPPRPRIHWPVPSLSFPRTQSASTQILQASLVVLAIGFVTFILYLYLLPNSQISEAEARMDQLKAQHAALTRQNAEIVRQLSAYTDLGTVQQRAKRLGMTPARNVIFLPAAGKDELATQEPMQRPAADYLEPESLTDQTATPGNWLDLLRRRGATAFRQLGRAAAP